MICGFKDISLIDYPGHIAPVVFIGGCNFRCGFCYNRSLVLDPEGSGIISTEEIFKRIREMLPLAEGVVITGGEPTTWPELESFARRLKHMGLKVKLDTNGSKPEVLQSLLDKRLVDYIAMDIKSSPGRYSKAAGVKFNPEVIKKSIEVIKRSGIDHQFRTTCVPGLTKIDDISDICRLLGPGGHYCLQQFQAKDTLDPELATRKPMPAEKLNEFRQAGEAFGVNIEIIWSF